MHPNTAFILPKTSDQLPKADLRREITPWRALVWAYHDEALRAATNGLTADQRDRPGSADNGMAEVRYGERMARGTVGGWLPAHEDAFAIDAWLWWACGGRDGAKPYQRIVAAAEKRVPIAPRIDVPLIQCVPVLNKRGEPKLIYPMGRTDRAYLCVITFEGVPREKAEALQRAHAAFYELFTAVLVAMQDVSLVKWRVLPHNPS